MPDDRSSLTRDQIRECLRHVRYPGYSRDIVSFGFVREIAVERGCVTVVFAPNTRRDDKVAEMVETIQATLLDLAGVRTVEVDLRRPFETPDDGGLLTPLQAELLEAGIDPERDPMLTGGLRADLAPEAGYGEAGPAPLGLAGARPRPASTVYDGPLPVFQWEVDPTDPTLEAGDTHVVADGWEFDVWWQAHPADLVYVSIQALADDQPRDTRERRHPMGRNVVVNLVYDRRRAGVVAIYGTAGDFRPFVEAFRHAFGLVRDAAATASSTPVERQE